MTIDPRSGAAKKTQNSFEDKWGMKDMTTMSGIAPGSPGSGPDASSPNPLDPEPRGKVLQDQPVAKWDQVNGDGQGLDQNIGGKVIGEAILSGAGKLPSGTKEN